MCGCPAHRDPNAECLCTCEEHALRRQKPPTKVDIAPPEPTFEIVGGRYAVEVRVTDLNRKLPVLSNNDDPLAMLERSRRQPDYDLYARVYTYNQVSLLLSALAQAVAEEA